MSARTVTPGDIADDLLDLLDWSQFTRGPWSAPVVEEQGERTIVTFSHRSTKTPLRAEVSLDRVQVQAKVDDMVNGYTMTPALFLTLGWDEVMGKVEEMLGRWPG